MKRGPFLFLAAAALVMALSGTPYGSGSGILGEVRYRGEGLPGVYVEVFGWDTTGEEAALASTNTGEGGRFEVSLPPGRYRLTAKKRPEGGGSGGMLFGTSGAEPVKVGGSAVRIPVMNLRDQGGSGGAADGGTMVSGRILNGSDPAPGAFVYFYPGTLRRGPGYLSRARTGPDGGFEVGLEPGTYTITVRFADAGDGMGTVGRDDLVGEFAGNPITLGDSPVDLGAIALRSVDAVSWEEKRWGTALGRYLIRGRITGEDGDPVPGAYAFVYADHRMVGKPAAISPPTGAEGTFTVVVQRPGTYYLGARTRYGGPVEPGELMGAWDGSGPRPIVLDEDGPEATCDIVVREVW
ncbi:MAG: carboxypeptidase regulatory-like domain-containing protein [bacterium]|nr:MAG: carboxypeptidase regulatory-like domain-containing protein [bacterium]